MQGNNDLVFEATQAEVGLGEEVARTCRKVSELEPTKFALECLQATFPVILGAGVVGQEFSEVSVEVVEEQRIDNPVNVGDARVVHTALASGLRVQG